MVFPSRKRTFFKWRPRMSPSSVFTPSNSGASFSSDPNPSSLPFFIPPKIVPKTGLLIIKIISRPVFSARDKFYDEGYGMMRIEILLYLEHFRRVTTLRLH